MNHPINFSKFNSKLRAGFSIPARRAEFCWTPTFLRDRADAGAFTVLKRSDLRCCDFSMTWGASFTYWHYLSDIELLAEVLAVGMFAMVECEIPANRVIGTLLRVPEVRRCARGSDDGFAESSRVNRLLSVGLQNIVVDGLPAKQIVADLRRDRAVRKWMHRYPDYIRA